MKMENLTPYIPAVIIFVGALFAAYYAKKDTNEAKEKQGEINRIGKLNEELNSKILFMSEELNKITTEVKIITKENGEISKENSSLSKQNLDISKTIKKISDKIEKISKQNLNNTSEIKDYSNAETFFREKDFSFLKNLFPDGCIINRQNFSHKNYSKSTVLNSPIIEDINSYIKVEKDFAELVNIHNSKINNGGIIDGVTMRTRIRLNYFGNLQKLQGHRINNSCQYLVMIDVDEDGYTFAVGRAPCGQRSRF